MPMTPMKFWRSRTQAPVYTESLTESTAGQSSANLPAIHAGSALGQVWTHLDSQKSCWCRGRIEGVESLHADHCEFCHIYLPFGHC